MASDDDLLIVARDVIDDTADVLGLRPLQDLIDPSDEQNGRQHAALCVESPAYRPATGLESHPLLHKRLVRRAPLILA